MPNTVAVFVVEAVVGGLVEDDKESLLAGWFEMRSVHDDLMCLTDPLDLRIGQCQSAFALEKILRMEKDELVVNLVVVGSKTDELELEQTHTGLY